jgi:hypothetical protein
MIAVDTNLLVRLATNIGNLVDCTKLAPGVAFSI